MDDIIPRRRFLTAAAGGAFAAGLGVDRDASCARRGAMMALLTPVTRFKGPALAFDFPALHVGVAEYAEGPT